jgi:hypothetical protein
VYGKTIENKRKRTNVNVVTSEKSAINLIRKPTIKEIITIDEDLSLYRMKKTAVLLDKPIYVGSAILDYAKLIMLQIHYDFFKTKYGSKARLCYTDTGK